MESSFLVCHLKKKEKSPLYYWISQFFKIVIHEIHPFSVLLNGDTHIFSTFFRISTSLSTAGSSKSCTLKLLFLRGVSHSWQFPAPLTNSRSTQLSHLWEKGRGAKACRCQTGTETQDCPPFLLFAQHISPGFHCFCSTHQWQEAMALHPGWTAQSQQHKHIDSPCPNNSGSLLGPNVNPNKMMGSVSRGSLFIDTSKPISHGPDCNILIYSKHHLAAQKTLFIFLREFSPSMDTNLACRLPRICQSYHRETATTNLS